MTENKLQRIARTLGGWILASKGEEKEAFAQVLVLVTQAMGGGDECTTGEDPIFWFDDKGRFCTRARTKEELENSMILMDIAEGLCSDESWESEESWENYGYQWNAFREINCKYKAAISKIGELEKERDHLQHELQHRIWHKRVLNLEHAVKLIDIAMSMAGRESLEMGEIFRCLELAQTIEEKNGEGTE